MYKYSTCDQTPTSSQLSLSHDIKIKIIVTDPLIIDP